MALSSEADRSGDLHRSLPPAVGRGVTGLLHTGEARHKTRPDGNAQTRVRTEDGGSKIKDRRWKIEDGRSRIEDRGSNNEIRRDPRSSIPDPRPPVVRRRGGAR